MQTSYERVKNALYFGGPDRLPVEFEAFGNNDFHYMGWNQTGTGDRNKRHTVDEWGCTWSRSQVANMGLVTGHPLADWNALESFSWPDPDDEAFYRGMEKKLEGSEGKYVRTGIFALLFERMHHLHGFENTLIDLYEEREKLEALADRIVEFDLRIIENISKRFPGQIHGFDFTDDWGTERAAFLGCDMFREFFFPRYQRIFDACKAVGWDVWMHSCGKINALLPMLLESGVNALNMLQPRTNGIKEIGEAFAGKVCFYTCCDIQKTLVTGTEEEIVAEAKELMNTWGTKDGGFILSDYGDSGAIGCRPERKKIMYDAFLENDPWKAARE